MTTFQPVCNQLSTRLFASSTGTLIPISRPYGYSAGTRGATSAEYFLAHDYAVIFLHRQFSQQPFLRHYSHSTNPFLDFLEVEESPCPGASSNPRITVNPHSQGVPLLLRVVKEHHRVKKLGTLHMVTFVTVDDYLFLLRGIAGILSRNGTNGVGRQGLFYLAAAVSDFFVPRQKLVCVTMFPSQSFVVLGWFSVDSSSCLVRAQDSIWQRHITYRNGSSSEDPQSVGE